jgi:hypothetical protein
LIGASRPRRDDGSFASKGEAAPNPRYPVQRFISVAAMIRQNLHVNPVLRLLACTRRPSTLLLSSDS